MVAISYEDYFPDYHDLAENEQASIRWALADAWDMGYETGHKTARAVNEEWPDTPKNPFLNCEEKGYHPANPEVGPRCGECRLGTGIHNTDDPLCEARKYEQQEEEPVARNLNYTVEIEGTTLAAMQEAVRGLAILARATETEVDWTQVELHKFYNPNSLRDLVIARAPIVQNDMKRL